MKNLMRLVLVSVFLVMNLPACLFDVVSLAAEKIYSAGEGRLGTDEDLIVEVFTGHTLLQMQHVMVAYDTKYDTSLASAVDSEFSGNIGIALSALLSGPVDTYCRRLKAAQHGVLGTTDEKVINRIIAGNDKESVRAISDRYFQKYDVDLATSLGSKLSGDYKNAVVSYIKRKDPAAGLEGTTALRLDEAAAAAAEIDRLAKEAQEAAAAAKLLQAEMEIARLQDESAAIAAARQADEERAAREAEEREARAAAALAAAEEASIEERRKLSEQEAELAALRERLEAAKRADEAVAAEKEALRKQMEAEREAAAQRAKEEEEAAIAATAGSTDDDSSSSESSSDDNDDNDADIDEETRKRRRERRENKRKMRADRVARRAAKHAGKAAKKDAKKAMKGLKKLGKR